MQPDEQTIADADARFTEWMRLNLDRAAEHFGLSLIGEPVFGWRLRTIGAPATGPDGPRWLRVVTEFPEWAAGDTWTGNLDANTIAGVSKPRVLDVLEWDEQNWRHQRTEMLTLLPGAAISRGCSKPILGGDGRRSHQTALAGCGRVRRVEQPGLRQGCGAAGRSCRQQDLG